MKEILIVSVLGFFIASCSKPEPPQIETVYVETPVVAPVVPRVDQLTLRPVNWLIITEDTADEILTNNQVIYGITVSDYENLALNLSDIRSSIDQYQAIIRIYENSYR